MWSNSLSRRRSDRLKPLKTHEESSDTRRWLECQWHLRCLKCAEIVGNVWIFRRKRFDIADFDVDFLYAGPFCARAEEPAPLSDDACSVERIARDQKLHALAGAEIWTNYGALACAIFVQHKNFNRITQVTVIKLIAANAMES